jgi:hypothetical protein
MAFDQLRQIVDKGAGNENMNEHLTRISCFTLPSGSKSSMSFKKSGRSEFLAFSVSLFDCAQKAIRRSGTQKINI